MSNIPSPPEWPFNTVSLSDEAKSDLNKISADGFFDGAIGLRDAAKELDYKIIGEGTGRIVLTSDKLPAGTVAKVAKGQKGSNFNLNETFNYDEAPNSIKPYLTPVVSQRKGSSGWIVSVKCEKGDNQTVKDLIDILNYHNINYDKIEVCRPNVGKYKGSPCIIDYDNLFK